jgi:1-acyl-sn-glycerol-3-phosphate acyltransferase
MSVEASINLSKVHEFSRQVPAIPAIRDAACGLAELSVRWNRRVIFIEPSADTLLRSGQGHLVLSEKHQSHMDAITIAETLEQYGPLAIAVGADYWNPWNLIHASLMERYNMIPVPRPGEEISQEVHIARPDDLVLIVNHEINLLMFPGGGRDKGFNFHDGAAYIADKLIDRPIITIGLAGGDCVMPKGSIVPSIGRTIGMYISSILPQEISENSTGKSLRERRKSLTRFFQNRMRLLHESAQGLIHYDWKEWVEKTKRLQPHFGYIRVDRPHQQIYPASGSSE